MTTTASPVRLRQYSPAYWRVTFDNPSINLHDTEVVAGLKDLVDRLDANPHVQVGPEIGFGFFPGGGLERLPLVTGRSRAMEIITGGEDFDADTAERYGWINRSVPDTELDAFTDRFATQVASFDRLATKTAKEILNTRSHIAVGSDQTATYARFLDAFARPEVKARIQRFMEKGGQQKDDLELNLGEHLPEL
jgi:enoyl-CoA hydratase/carnithine racemase